LWAVEQANDLITLDEHPAAFVSFREQARQFTAEDVPFPADRVAWGIEFPKRLQGLLW
jgi:hypothetical protein